MNFPATLRAVRELSARWQGATTKLIEDKANRSAVIQMLQHELLGIIPVNPQGGKVARAAAISPVIEAGNVYLPHPEWAPWVWEFIEECAAFPNGKHDDQVDTMTQAILYSLSRRVYRTYQICPCGSVPFRACALILRGRRAERTFYTAIRSAATISCKSTVGAHRSLD
jgi:predicted phage terminase large subunit-like protein